MLQSLSVFLCLAAPCDKNFLPSFMRQDLLEVAQKTAVMMSQFSGGENSITGRQDLAGGSCKMWLCILFCFFREVKAALSPGCLNCMVHSSQLGQIHQIYLFTSMSLLSAPHLHCPSPSRQQGRQRWSSLPERSRLDSHKFPLLGEECQADISNGESSM